MKSSRSLCLLIIIFVCGSIFAQNSPPNDDAAEKEKAQRELEKRQELTKKVVVMLGEIAGEADSLKLSINRVSVYSTVGVLLWKHDEKRARNVINGAAQEIIAAQNADELEDSSYGNTEWQTQEARRQLVQPLAAYDAEFALLILRQTRPADIDALMQSPKNLLPNGNDYSLVQNEINLEQSILNELSRQDPKRAVKLARELLSKGISYALLDLIDRIKDKEPAEAAQLADEVMQKLQSADFSGGHNERNLAINFITRYAPKPETGGEKSKFAVSESGLRALVDKITNFFLRDSQAENFYYQISQVAPVIEKLSPPRASQLRQREKELKQKRAQNNPYERMNQINENADAETLISEAQNASAELKSQYYTYAANKLINADASERARAVVNLIPDRRTRDYALQNLNSQLFYKALNAGNIEEARRLAAQMANRNLQISMYIQIYNNLKQKKDEKAARQILDEAASLITANPENREEMTTTFQVANAYTSVAPEISLTLIEPTISKFNELINAGALINRFSSNQKNQPDEITALNFQGLLSQYGFYYNQIDFARLALASFERTSNLAAGFQRPEARIFTRLMILQAILTQFGNKEGISELPLNTRMFSLKPGG